MKKINLKREAIDKIIKQNLQKRIQRIVASQGNNTDIIQLIDSVLLDLGIIVKYDLDDLSNLSKERSFICISNQALIGLEKLILLKIFLNSHPDFKIVTSDFVGEKSIFDSYIINEDKTYDALTEAKEYLESGYPFGIFPAGWNKKQKWSSKRVVDIQWRSSIIKFIKSSKVPIVPVHISSERKKVGQILNQIHPILGNPVFRATRKKNKKIVIKVKIGSKIKVKEQDEFDSSKQFGRFLRLKVDHLNSAINVQNFFIHKRRIEASKAEKIVEAIDPIVLTEEIEQSRKEYFLMASKNFSIFCIPSKRIPNLMLEIGRLREITFREVGEGTNRSIDIDEFDIYYEQLLIWDEVEHKIVGAYRIGRGKEIMKKYGRSGFYLSTLFHINKKFIPILNESVELGRSFIVKEYQKKSLSLFMLWKGILYFLLKNSNYRYLIGPVSISGEFNKTSKSLIVEFVKDGYFRNDLAKFVRPRKRFKLPRQFKKHFDKEIFLANTKRDFKKLDQFIRDIDKKSSTPILLKKYLSIGAQIVGFNTDPDFNNCLDGLLILDLFDIPTEVLENLSKDVGVDAIEERLIYSGLFN